MLLGQTATSPSLTSFSNPRQIVVAQGAASTIMYTVPSGKKFQGTMHTNYAGQTASITPSGGVSATFVIPSAITSYASASALPVTLVAGSIVKNELNSGNPTYLIGVETDA